MLPTVDFCGLRVSRLIIGANPFGGFSHQNKERNREMVAYHTVDRILETWERAKAASINTMVTNNETSHVVEAVKQHLAGRAPLQWIAQVNDGKDGNMPDGIAKVVRLGCKAIYFHGMRVDSLHDEGDAASLSRWCECVRAHGLPVGVAGHNPATHLWVDSLDLVDFHAVCFFNCGSVHAGEGERFRLRDMDAAISFIRDVRKPCIGHKNKEETLRHNRRCSAVGAKHVSLYTTLIRGSYRRCSVAEHRLRRNIRFFARQSPKASNMSAQGEPWGEAIKPTVAR